MGSSRSGSRAARSSDKHRDGSRPTAIDLFCGAGGLTEGLKTAGFRVVAGLEVNKTAAETYRLNHRGSLCFEDDIRAVDPGDLLKSLQLRPGELSLLAGCPPCQGFSQLRTLNKSRIVEDARNDLVFEYLRFVRAMRPSAILLENVPALATDPRMDTLVHELEKLGYPAGKGLQILNAEHYGVPQRRRRLVMMVTLNGPVVVSPNVSPRPATVRDAIGHLKRPGDTGDIVHDLPERRSAKVVDLIRRIPRNGGSRLDLPAEDQLACHVRTDGFKDVYGRMAWDKPAPTITSGCYNPSKGRFLHPDQDRCITMREAALLQTFPEHYRFSLAAGKQGVAGMIGNALPPKFVRSHARAARKQLVSD